MSDSELNISERRLQPRFSLAAIIRLAVLALFAVLLAGDRTWNQPDRTPRPDRSIPVRYVALQLPAAAVGDLPLAGLWRLQGRDPRLGGVSGLAIDGARLLAVTDSGSVLQLPRPGAGGTARVRDLPAGPGSPYWKKYRDAESLAADPGGRGWWVGFEFKHALYLYDPAFRRASRRIVFADERWPPNGSLEAMVQAGVGLLAMPETGEELLRVEEENVIARALAGSAGAPADAVRLADGRVLVLLRSVRPWGLRNHLTELRRTPGGYRLRTLGRLPLGPFDNAEGLAAETGPDGRVRLWVMTDNDFSSWRSTLLMAIDLQQEPRR
jgi:hypothetical protein